MGWASGSDIACEMAAAIKKHVKEAGTRKRLYIALVGCLESNDWDTQDEALGIDPILDKVIEEGQS